MSEPQGFFPRFGNALFDHRKLVLLIGGSNSQVGALRADRDLVLMEWSRTEIPATSRSQPVCSATPGLSRAR